MNARWWNLSLRLTALAVALISAISVWLAWNTSPDLFARLSVVTLAPILAFAFISYSLRVVRFHFFLRAAGVPISWRGTLVVQIVGFTLSVTPGHIGEVFKLHLIRERSGTPVTQTAPVLVLDRVTEGAGFLVLALVSAIFVPALRTQVPSSVVLVLGLVVLLVFAVAQYLIRGKHLGGIDRLPGMTRLERFIPHLQNLWRGLQATFTVPQIAVGVLLTGIARSADGMVIFFAARLLGVDILPAAAILILAVSGLAGGISLLPAGTGAVETTMIGLLVLTGAPLSSAVGITLLARLATLWIWVALGLLLAFALQLTPQKKAAQMARDLTATKSDAEA